jgi:hypothetical protein
MLWSLSIFNTYSESDQFSHLQRLPPWSRLSPLSWVSLVPSNWFPPFLPFLSLVCSPYGSWHKPVSWVMSLMDKILHWLPATFRVDAKILIRLIISYNIGPKSPIPTLPCLPASVTLAFLFFRSEINPPNPKWHNSGPYLLFTLPGMLLPLQWIECFYFPKIHMLKCNPKVMAIGEAIRFLERRSLWLELVFL